MMLDAHAETALIALGQRMPIPASVVIARLKAMSRPPGSLAIEVCRLQFAIGTNDSSNGDSVVVIVRRGIVKTAMLRRSWNQPFTSSALNVEEVQSWQ